MNNEIIPSPILMTNEQLLDLQNFYPETILIKELEKKIDNIQNEHNKLYDNLYEILKELENLLLETIPKHIVMDLLKTKLTINIEDRHGNEPLNALIEQYDMNNYDIIINVLQEFIKRSIHRRENRENRENETSTLSEYRQCRIFK